MIKFKKQQKLFYHHHHHNNNHHKQLNFNMANSINKNEKIALLIMDAQRLANHVKELDALGSALLVEAEGNKLAVEHMRQFQDDIDSLNKLARNKSNTDMINRINQQNPSIREIRQENRELKASLEDHQRALELIMHKYREHTQHKIFQNRINYKELYNEKLSDIIRKQSDKINEMAAVMQKAASIDDDAIYKEIEWMNKLKIENQGLRELLHIANEFGSANLPITNNIDLSINNKTTIKKSISAGPGPSENKYIQTDIVNNINNSNNISDVDVDDDISAKSITPIKQSDMKFIETLLLKNIIPSTEKLIISKPENITEDDIKISEEKDQIENNDDDNDINMDVDIVLKSDVDLYKTIKKGKLLQNTKNTTKLLQNRDDKKLNINKIDENLKELTKLTLLQKSPITTTTTTTTPTTENLNKNTTDKLLLIHSSSTEKLIKTPTDNVIQLLEDVCNENNYDESETDDDSTIHNLSNGSTTNEESSDDENNINDITILNKNRLSIKKSPSSAATTTNEIIEEKLSS